MEKKKILLIEARHDLAELYKEVFSRKFSVDVAHDGKEGLEKAKNRPDLILLDILLPSMNGYQVLKNLKQDKSVKKIPVVVLTNFTSKHVDDDKKLALLMGAEDYLVKTRHQPQEILEKISVYLPI